VCANLEGPITEHASRSEGSVFGSAENYQFTFDPAIRDILIAYNFCVVNIGNNHIDNFDREGIDSTKKFLEEKNIIYFGDTGIENEKRYAIITVHDVKIGIVNMNQFVVHARDHVFEDIASVREQSDFVVVYTHWGVEYASQSRDTERVLAHEMIDAGADVIIGTHPHVVQDHEEYGGKRIYYSLGNFVFDQYFRPDTQKGLAVSVTFDKDHDMITFQEHDVCMKKTGVTVLCDSI
jgi:poly-gamma-glutamate synthesis protein (capsule biosynthesis protein)